MIGHKQDGQIIFRHAKTDEVQRGGERKSGDGIYLSLGQHRLSGRKTDRLHSDIGHVETVLGGKDRKLRPCAIGRRRAQNLACQIGGCFDPLRLAADHGKWRFVVDHHRRDDRRAGVLVKEFHQAVDIGKTHRKGSRRHFRDRIERTGTFRDFHCQALGLEIAFVHGDEIGRCGAFEFPVQREWHRGLRGQRCCKGQGRRNGGKSGADHRSLPVGCLHQFCTARGEAAHQGCTNAPFRPIAGVTTPKSYAVSAGLSTI